MVSMRPRVLIADDYPAMVTAISRLLSLDNDIVGTVADGSTLLEAAQRLRPDVIVLDLNLPKLSGLEACRQITRALPEIKIVVLTAALDPARSQEALDAGASAFVSKLKNFGDLLTTIARLCVDLPGKPS
jgi:CheY-like chemotaxis protein